MGQRTAERRRSPRFEMACPVRIYDADGALVARSKTVNISDGGAFVALPIEQLSRLGGAAELALSVPRSTPTTHMLEDFSCRATVVRQEPMVDEAYAGVALEFDEPLELALEV